MKAQLVHIHVLPTATILRVIQSQEHQQLLHIIAQLLQEVGIHIKAQVRKIQEQHGQATPIQDLLILKRVLLQQVQELLTADPQVQAETLIADLQQAQVHPDLQAAVRAIAVHQGLQAAVPVIAVLHDHQAAVQATAARLAPLQAAVPATAAVPAQDHPEAAIAVGQAVPDHLLPLHHHREAVVQVLQDHPRHLHLHLHRTEDNRTTYKPD